MDQTAIKSGVPPQAETGIQEPPLPEPRPVREPKGPALRCLEVLADLRITVVLFALAMILVFWGTLAQVDNGVWTVVQKYFRSYFVWVPLKVVSFNYFDNTRDAIPFPGGWLIGGAMLVNLLAAHAIRFKLSWNRAGIFLIHIGIIIMMAGEFVTGTYAVEGMMEIKEGRSSREVTQNGKAELAIILSDEKNIKKDEVITVPGSLLKTGAAVDRAEVPFKIEVTQYMINSRLKDGRNNLASEGFGKHHIAQEMPEVAGVDPEQKVDVPSAYMKISDKKGNVLGTWLFSRWFDDPQWITVDGQRYQVILRFKQTTRPFTMHLTKFKHEKFPGTETPKDFHSYIRLTDSDDNVDRDVEIYMNAPLYYRGETFYQSSWTTDMHGRANGTILQVVRNPGWLLPYVSCGVVGFGLLIHFGLTLYRFVDRRIVR